MPVAQIFTMPGHDGSDGTGKPPIESMLPWIALSIALTAIACVWLGRASVPFMLALAAWAGLALARQRTDGPAIASATPSGPHIRLVTPPRAAAPNADAKRAAPVLRIVSHDAARRA